MIKKLGALFVPYLLISIGLLLGYSLFDWLLGIGTGWITLREEIAQFWLPVILSSCAVYLWIRPKLAALDFRNSNSRFLYYVLATAGIAVPVVIAQIWLVAATGVLTRLRSINEIDDSPLTRYYSAAQISLDTRQISLERSADFYRSDLHLSVFIVAPLSDFEGPPLSQRCHVWLAAKYRETIRARTPQSEIEHEFARFVNECFLQFSKIEPKSFSYFEIAGPSGDQKAWKAAIRRSRYHDTAREPIILIGRTGSFDQRTGKEVRWILVSFAIGAAAWFALLLPKDIDESKLRRASTRRMIRADAKALVVLAGIAKQFPVTSVIIAINVLVFVSMAVYGLGFVSFKPADLIAWGGNYSPLVRQGQWLRLITALFIHGGIMHLLMNAYGLVFAALFLEQILGTFKYIFTYLFTGVIASLTSVWAHPGGVSVGASGAIFGLYGVLLVFLAGRNAKDTRTTPVLLNVAIFVALNLLLGGVTVGTDNAAHAAGLISGLLLGVVLLAMSRGKIRRS